MGRKVPQRDWHGKEMATSPGEAGTTVRPTSAGNLPPVGRGHSPVKHLAGISRRYSRVPYLKKVIRGTPIWRPLKA